MQIPIDGVIEARVVFDSYPTDPGTTAELSFDRVTWFAFDTPPIAQPDGTYAGWVILRGPNSNSADGHVVQADFSPLWARVTDAPQVVPVHVGVITFY